MAGETTDERIAKLEEHRRQWRRRAWALHDLLLEVRVTLRCGASDAALALITERLESLDWTNVTGGRDG